MTIIKKNLIKLIIIKIILTLKAKKLKKINQALKITTEKICN